VSNDVCGIHRQWLNMKIVDVSCRVTYFFNFSFPEILSIPVIGLVIYIMQKKRVLRFVASKASKPMI
jgi:hypothetical protein